MILLLAACHAPRPDTDHGGDSDSDGTHASSPIVVYFTTDTLGYVAARDSDWCGRIGTILGSHGLDVACLDGAVSPSSWTAPSHTRMLFPANMNEADAWRDRPACGDTGVLPAVAEAWGATYVVGTDNPVLSHVRDPDCDGGAGFDQHADIAYDESGAPTEVLDWPIETRPATLALDDLLELTADGGPLVAFLNAWDVGGHWPPRCVRDPDSPACDALWTLAVEGGVVDPDADRTQAFLSPAFREGLENWFDLVDEATLRPVVWATILDAIAVNRGPYFDDRLERLLSGLEQQGRLGDLVLIVAGDHGENPGVRTLGGMMSASHTGPPTEWNAIVPVFVSPASLATGWEDAGLVGDATHPWSAVNLAYGLIDLAGIPAPEDWPAADPVGTALSWSCVDYIDPQTHTAGVRVDGDVALRCRNDACEATSWAIPGDLAYDPVVLRDMPEAFAPYAGSPNWAADYCRP